MKTDLTSFRVNVPRILRIRGSLGDLKSALVGRITGEYLEYLKGNSDSAVGIDDDAQRCLSEQNFVIDDSQNRIGLTHFGTGLLFDQGTHFEGLMLQTHETRGYDRARNRIEGLAIGILSADRLIADANAFGRDMLSRMDHRAATIAAT